MNSRNFKVRTWLVATSIALATFMAQAVAANAAPGDPVDLNITKTSDKASVVEGSNITYTIKVSNLSADPATGVTVVDKLPKGTTFVSAESSLGTCSQSKGQVTCAIGVVAPSTPMLNTTVTVTIVVKTTKSGNVNNTATVSGIETDPATANNSSTAQTKVTNAPKPVPPATVPTCRGVTATIFGTGGSDQLTGTSGRDVVVAFGGNDRIATYGGRDLICAGKGADYVLSGAGDDRVFGGAGNDRLIGGAGNDVLKGNAGNDVLKGRSGSDRLFGGIGFDRCVGGAGSDLRRSCEA